MIVQLNELLLALQGTMGEYYFRPIKGNRLSLVHRARTASPKQIEMRKQFALKYAGKHNSKNSTL